MRNAIIAALDVPTAEQALKLAEQIAPAVGAFKIGSELFTAAGPDIVRRVRATGASVFLDLKFHDIPNTVAKAVAAAKQDINVGSEAPLINVEGANTTTTITGRSIQDLPNPGGDLTYPAQFAPGALINTAGSSNDFVGGQNGYGNVQFNGLPALSNAYI